jgi:F-type H+-transporting ATPase subunit a
MEEISLAAPKIAHIGSFGISNSMLLGWIATAVIAVCAIVVGRKNSLIPQGFRNFIEMVVEYLYKTVNEVIGDEKKTKKYLPLLATIFIFVVINNWMGLLPGIGSIGINELKEGEHVLVPIFRGANADLNTTLALAIVAVISVQVFGVAAVGTAKYAKKFFNFSNPINFFVGGLELISEFSKMISFSFRLFGNIFAGEILLMVIAYLVPVIVPLPFFVLEIFVGLIQGLVFMMLTLVFIKGATAAHH